MTNITKLYQQLQEGKTTREYFVREARRQFPQFISPVTSFTDAVNILKSKRLVSENVIKEVSGAYFDAPPMKETHKLDAEQILDRMSPYAVKKGMEVELKKEKTYDNTTIDKIKERVARKLKKNPNAYDDQIIANVKKVEKQDKELETTELNKQLVDKKNAMRKPKGFKADKANTKASKKENRKGKPKGVKVMPDKGVIGTEKVIKENIEDDEYMKPRPGGPLFSPEDREEAEFDSLKMKVKGWYRTNFANPKSQLASKWDKEFYDKVEAASNKEELKQIVQSILMGDTSSVRKQLGLDEDKTAVLENIKQWLQENIEREYHPGMEVKTPDGHGVVKEVKGGTLTVELDDSNLKDYQFNVVNKLMDAAEEEPTQQIDEPTEVDPDKAERDAAFAKLPNLGSVRGSGNVIPKSWWQDITKEEKIAAIIERLNKMEEGEKKEKIKEMIKSKLNEAGDIVTVTTPQGEKVVSTTKSGQGKEMVNSLKSKGITSAKSTTAS